MGEQELLLFSAIGLIVIIPISGIIIVGLFKLIQR
jgi:hypothetical protein